MAQKRMFSLKIVDTDEFLDMPQSTQNLYFHLGMRADDEGFIGNVKRIMKMIGSSEDDKKVLLAKRFLIEFESGVVVIKHWRLNNYLQNDRIKETTYLQEKSLLYLKENGIYTLDKEQGTPMYTKCIHSIDKYSIEENSIDKNSIDIIADKSDTKRFTPPIIEDVKAYCLERQNGVDYVKWWNFYNSKNWYVGKNKMKNWKSAIITWEKSDNTSKEEKKLGVWL